MFFKHALTPPLSVPNETTFKASSYWYTVLWMLLYLCVAQGFWIKEEATAGNYGPQDSNEVKMKVTQKQKDVLGPGYKSVTTPDKARADLLIYTLLGRRYGSVFFVTCVSGLCAACIGGGRQGTSVGLCTACAGACCMLLQ